jgi:3-dehydroquinate synthase
MHNITIKFPRNPRNVYVGINTLSQFGETLGAHKVGKKGLLITNATISKLYARVIIESCQNVGFTVDILELPEGEQYKNLTTIQTILDKLVENKLERKDFVLALGGGVIGDMAGFAAAIYLRGINLIQIPTSLLAQVDSSLGGKTGVNHAKGKNLIGSFYQPIFTFIDLATLKTLPQKEIRCGLAEIVKYGVIQNPRLFNYLEQHASQIKAEQYTQDLEIWEYLVLQSCTNKAYVVAKDEKESNLREILNFGHTLGHAIETAFEYTYYSHGEAVAIGMHAACLIAVQQGLLAPNIQQKIATLLLNLGFNLSIAPIQAKQIETLLFSDKKVKDGKLRFVLPTKIGKVIVSNEVPAVVIHEIITSLIEEQK